MGLNSDGQHSEALGVANRCLEIVSANFECIIRKAHALLDLNRPEAKAVVERGLSYPAITAYDAEYKSVLRTLLATSMSHCQVSRDSQLKGRQRDWIGLFCKWRGHIVTNSDVVRGCGSLAMVNGTPLKFIVSDDKSDLALLQAVGTKPPGVATFPVM